MTVQHWCCHCSLRLGLSLWSAFVFATAFSLCDCHRSCWCCLPLQLPLLFLTADHFRFYHCFSLCCLPLHFTFGSVAAVHVCVCHGGGMCGQSGDDQRRLLHHQAVHCSRLLPQPHHTTRLHQGDFAAPLSLASAHKVTVLRPCYPFSIIKQSIALGCFPNLTILHLSTKLKFSCIASVNRVTVPHYTCEVEVLICTVHPIKHYVPNLTILHVSQQGGSFALRACVKLTLCRTLYMRPKLLLQLHHTACFHKGDHVALLCIASAHKADCTAPRLSLVNCMWLQS